MKLLSIDVGIKNLAYCLLEQQTPVVQQTLVAQQTPQQQAEQHIKIIQWDVINLCGKDPVCSECKKNAKFAQAPAAQAPAAQAPAAQAQQHYCAIHAKKSGLLLPSPNISLKKIKKMKLSDLLQVMTDYNIPNSPAATKKDDILKLVLTFLAEKVLITVASAKANDMDLVTIGCAMRQAFDTVLKDHLASITHIAIENQISPIANRMKTLQGMIAQYFIMHDKTQIAFVSAANKLKGHVGSEADIATDTSTYAARKKEGIAITLKLLNERCKEWVPHFTQHKKKDDLADAFLQGNWYLQKN
jgi:hypothetical protein